MADTSELSFDGRRYSAVAVTHDALRSLDDLTAVCGRVEFARAKPILDEPGLVARRADWIHIRNHYPYGSKLRKSTTQADSNGRYKHRCYVAELGATNGSRTPTFVFASPHIRVVGGWSSGLGEAVENPRPKYAEPILDRLFRALGTSAMPYKATQITLQIPSNVDVDKVALTGKSPLISSLHARLAAETRPYAVRLELPRDKRPVRLHLDRHGNLWWHQANDESFGIVVRALASLRSGGYLGETFDLPHLRIVSEDNFG